MYETIWHDRVWFNTRMIFKEWPPRQVREAVSATLTRRAWMDVTSCAVEGDITLSRKGDDAYEDTFEVVMNHSGWWSPASYFQMRLTISPHPWPLSWPPSFLSSLPSLSHPWPLILFIVLSSRLYFPSEWKSVASASSTGVATWSARPAPSLSSSLSVNNLQLFTDSQLSVNNLLLTIKRPFSTKNTCFSRILAEASWTGTKCALYTRGLRAISGLNWSQSSISKISHLCS